MNSLTANNRLSQQLVVSVAEHLLLRHECRLPNLLAVSNHRELYLTVGGELCRNLTAGFVTEEDFMFMLFVGSQKHSALSIFAKTTRMSALALCGNSGVILLSVKDHQHIDSAIPGRYTVQAPYKAGVGIGVLELHTATIGALASFLLLQLSYTQIMVGWVGAPKGAPVSVCAGYANPAQFTTSEIGVSGGGSYPLHTEAAIMATVPALSRLNDEDLHKLSYVTTALSAMGNSGTQFVKQAVTFFGPDRHFEESWEVPAVSAARREDPYFKASYDNVDYSQIPAGFRG
ncbi:ash family protein [Escherichia coli]